MVLTQEIKGIIRARGMTIEETAEIIGMHPITLGRKLSSGDFSVSEAAKLSAALGISKPETIFFAPGVTDGVTNG